MSAYADEIFLSSDLHTITKEQLTDLFRQAFKRQSEKLGILAAFSRQDADYDPHAEISDDVRMGWAYRTISRYGPNVTIGKPQHPDMLRAGLSLEQIEEVGALIERWKRTGEGAPSVSRLVELIEAVGARSSAGNVAKATPVYLRALGEALLQTNGRYLEDPLPFDDLVSEGSEPPRQETLEHERDPDARPPRSQDPSNRPSGVARERTPVPTEGKKPKTDEIISVIAQRLISENLRDKTWETKTARQAAATFNLLERFLKEIHGVVSFGQILQIHLDGFGTLMRELSPNYGKSPADRTRSILALRTAGGALPPEKRGLSGGTRNRHLTFVGQLFRRAKAAGIDLNPDLRPGDLRAKKDKRGRDERRVPTKDAVSKIFHLPVFTGCASWDKLHEPGDHIFHRAAYFGPLLAHYQGMRREEYCGLATDDVISVHEGLPYLHVAPNRFRRLKNFQSIRNLALHPELVRLGFLDYVATLRSLGYERVFPDLYSATTKSPLGDRYYDELSPAFRTIGVTPHQARHFFGNELKQNRVQAEHRADILGHGGRSETTERYCDAIAIKLQLDLLVHIEVITRHLSFPGVHMLPWILEGKTAPWARDRIQAARSRTHKPS